MVYFIGAGPGDPELITVKGARLLKTAKSVIYAGSLVNPELLSLTDPQACKCYNSAGMTLQEVIAVMEEDARQGRDTIRLHTGDPSLYGAIKEQMDALTQRAIPFAVIPGVSSFAAAAAALPAEYTLPGVTQTVILTRIGGRTPVPEQESIARLAAHQAAMVVFLSVDKLETLCAQAGPVYGWDVPVAVVYKASWKTQRIVRGTAQDIVGKVREAQIEKTALILIGRFLESDYTLSRLYDAAFSHGYRTAAQQEE